MKKITLILMLLSLVLISACSMEPTATGKVTAELDDSKIKNMQTTNMDATLTNTGKEKIVGQFEFITDAPQSVTIMYPDSELLKFELMPGDSITRSLEVQASTSIEKSYYKITVIARLSDGTVLDTGNDVLVVKK